MSRNTIAESKDGTEQQKIREFVDLIKPQINKMGYEIDTQIPLPYTNFCDRIDSNNKGVDYSKGKKAYAVDVLVYRELENGDKIPLVVIEGKKKGYSTHDILTYSAKSRTHKAIFPHLRYGFIVLDADDQEFMSQRYHMHSEFDFEEIFPKAENEVDRSKRINSFIERLIFQADLAKKKHQIIFS